MASHPPRSRTTAPPKRVAPSAIPPPPLSLPQKRKSSAPKFFFAKTAQSRNFRRIILCIRQSIGASKIFKVTIQNFGKLTDAVVRIGKFTVFAGPNNTGKSFVSKALYSIFGAANANHLAAVYRPHVRSLIRDSRFVRELDDKEGHRHERLVDTAVRNLWSVIQDVSVEEDVDELSAIDNALPSISPLLGEIESAVAKLKRGRKKSEMGRADKIGEQVSGLLRMKKWGAKQYVKEGFRQQMKENFIGNFQVRNLSRLCGSDAASSDFGIEIEGVGNFVFGSEPTVKSISPEWLHTMQQYSKGMFLGSPLFWSLSSALKLGDRGTFFSRWERVPLVPKYFHDMMDAVSETGRGSPIFPELLEELTDQIGGRVHFERGEFRYEENNGGIYRLSQTAMGVANMGVFGLLLDRNLLQENTFLFIDEPEAHLHPAWQVAMTKMLVHLAEQGVNIVLATHSADILKWLEIYVKENPTAKGLFALNRFAKGTVKSGGGFNKGLTDTLDDLTEPYQDMFIRGLRA